MPSHNEEEPVEFKVVDRRKFTFDGDLRPDAASAPEPEDPPAVPVAIPASSPPAAAAVAPGSAPEPAAPPAPAEELPAAETAQSADGQLAGGIQFEHLVMSLVTQAMLQLGLAARPGELAPKPDLNAAHETIDILGILKTKTKGNLTAHEDQLLTGSLSELRMAFVEINRRMAGQIN